MAEAYPEAEAYPVEEAAPPGIQFPQTLDIGAVSEQTGAPVLDQFDPSAIPVFCVGEELWEQVPEEGAPAPAAGFVAGVSLRVAGEDSLKWGTRLDPALEPVLVVSPETESAGMCHVMSRDQVVAMGKPGLVFRVGSFLRSDGSASHDIVFIAMRRTPEPNMQLTARAVAKARGPKGSNYSLLVRLLHEHGRLGYEGELRLLVEAVDNILWPQQ
eukprot:TRINITY_DN999_c2_g1_i2.p2 TRINITY_DN999_c2_g1~~TRINITY_DN999_c2_g1_i2.p2  ORF type:complete len:240 (+),score=67.16 TRINITY_DN999_c2_g1_i2:81-722(+)